MNKISQLGACDLASMWLATIEASGNQAQSLAIPHERDLGRVAGVEALEALLRYLAASTPPLALNRGDTHRYTHR